jgi:hypothetical protein
MLDCNFEQHNTGCVHPLAVGLWHHSNHNVKAMQKKETITTLLQDNDVKNTLASLAWAGYIARGRGAIEIELIQTVGGVQIEVGYLPTKKVGEGMPVYEVSRSFVLIDKAAGTLAVIEPGTMPPRAYAALTLEQRTEFFITFRRDTNNRVVVEITI